jgi:hypothetical protein
MNRVKYAHHMDGEAHFSQDGKVQTRVRKRANLLNDCAGHLFTVQLQGLHDFAKFSDSELRKRRRMYVSLRYSYELSSLRIVAHLYSVEQFRRKFLITNSNGSAWFRMCVERKTLPAVLLSKKQPSLHLLSLSFEEIPPVSPRTESIFTFIGGFDHPSLVLDGSKDATFLMLISPAANDPTLAAEQLGSVDFVQD